MHNPVVSAKRDRGARCSCTMDSPVACDLTPCPYSVCAIPVVYAVWGGGCGLVVLDSPVACDLTPVPTGTVATRGLCAMG